MVCLLWLDIIGRSGRWSLMECGELVFGRDEKQTRSMTQACVRVSLDRLDTCSCKIMFKVNQHQISRLVSLDTECLYPIWIFFIFKRGKTPNFFACDIRKFKIRTIMHANLKQHIIKRVVFTICFVNLHFSG